MLWCVLRTHHGVRAKILCRAGLRVWFWGYTRFPLHLDTLDCARARDGPGLAVANPMRRQGALLIGVFLLTGCVGPGQHVRGGHAFHGSHHGRHCGGVDGLFAILEGVALIVDIASSVSQVSGYEQAARSLASPPPPPPARVQGHWLQGTLVMPEPPHSWLPVMRVALKAANQEGATVLAYSACNHAGQFSFALPPAGNYKLEIVDPYYEGEMVFATDGVSDLPLVMPIAADL